MWLGICSMGRTRIGFWTWIWSMDYLWSMNLVSFDSSNSTGAFDAKMNGSLLEENSSFKMLGLNFFSKLDRSSYIISIVKRALIRSMKFLSPEVALYLYKSTIQPWVERCCHVWADTGVEPDMKTVHHKAAQSQQIWTWNMWNLVEAAVCNWSVFVSFYLNGKS